MRRRAGVKIRSESNHQGRRQQTIRCHRDLERGYPEFAVQAQLVSQSRNKSTEERSLHCPRRNPSDGGISSPAVLAHKKWLPNAAVVAVRYDYRASSRPSKNVLSTRVW